MSTDENRFQKVEWTGDQWEPSDDDDASGFPLRPRGEGIADADLELLTLAARAIGAQAEPVDGEDWVNLYFADGKIIYAWNSLRHSSDAFELAADLDIDVLQSTAYREAQAVAPLRRVISESWGADKNASTRRAVTRAAAEIAVAQAKKQA
jgi:hypothetical protein